MDWNILRFGNSLPNDLFSLSICGRFHNNLIINYTQCTVKLRSNFQRIAQLKCTTNEKRNLSEHDEKNFKWKNFL